MNKLSRPEFTKPNGREIHFDLQLRLPIEVDQDEIYHYCNSVADDQKPEAKVIGADVLNAIEDIDTDETFATKLPLDMVKVEFLDIMEKLLDIEESE